jgi:hypothetical protein
MSIAVLNQHFDWLLFFLHAEYFTVTLQFEKTQKLYILITYRSLAIQFCSKLFGKLLTKFISIQEQVAQTTFIILVVAFFKFTEQMQRQGHLLTSTLLHKI